MTPRPHRPSHPDRSHRPAHLLVALIGLVLLVAASGCSSTSESSRDSAAAGSAAGSSRSSADQAAPQQLAAAGAGTASSPRDVALAQTAGAVVSTGTVSLRSRDVGALLAEVQLAVDQARGEVSERSSETDDDGELVRSRLVVRVPADSFGSLLGALESTGTLVSSDSTSEDVTAQVVDTRVRVAAQRASIARVQALLAEATDLDDVVAIEAQLTERQAALDSLEQTQAYLADQTSRSTITVSLARSHSPAGPAADDTTGFLDGLSAGWGALRSAGGDLATVAGALLPWLVVLGLVGAPVGLAARRLRRRTPRTSEPLA